MSDLQKELDAIEATSADEPSWEVLPSPLNDSHLAHLNDLWSARGRPCRMYGHPYTEDCYCERCGEPICDGCDKCEAWRP